MIYLSHLLSTLMMTAIIWFVQLVHYPLFLEVASSDFRQYEQVHQRRISWIVAPLMIIELLSSIAFFLQNLPAFPAYYHGTGLAMLAVIWGSTFLIQVPLHGRLAGEGHQLDEIRQLINSNWLRTIAWTIRALLAVWGLQMLLNASINKTIAIRLF